VKKEKAMTSDVKELVGKLEVIDNEITLLRTDRKELMDEYKEKLDIKTFRFALRILKIRKDAGDLALDEMMFAMTGDDNESEQ
tara:strand:- start:208 stop:456 length:249 start_codon:yes stop_codon:yes gene_type:complete